MKGHPYNLMLKVIWRITLNVRAISMIYIPQKVDNVFTGWSLLEMYLYISYMLCMLPFANRLMRRPMCGYIPSSVWYLPYSIIVLTRLLFYERRLGICVFMKLCLVYAISR